MEVEVYLDEYLECKDELKSFLFRMLTNRQDVEDILQEKIHRSHHRRNHLCHFCRCFNHGEKCRVDHFHFHSAAHARHNHETKPQQTKPGIGLKTKHDCKRILISKHGRQKPTHFLRVTFYCRYY
jgi:hypothetical protein